mgnify:FL=1
MKRHESEHSAVVGLLCLVLTVGGTNSLHGGERVADFDVLPVGAGGYWNGSDLSGGFTSDLVRFQNSYDTNWSFWAGFAYSRVNDTNTPGYGNQYAVWTPGTGVGGTGSYAVVYDSAWDEQDVVTFPFPVLVKGVYLNNTTYAALAMRDGDVFSKKFGGATGDDPDWFKVTITGRDAGGADVGSVDFYLADYRFTNNALDYIVGEWTWVDLSSLGPGVKSLHFTLSSSDTGAWGMNTPAYFAMDNLSFVYTFSSPAGATNLYDSPVPGFVGPAGDGRSDSSNNVINPAFCGWASEVVNYSPAPGVASQWTNAMLALGQVTGSNMDIVSLGDLTAEQIATGALPGTITLRLSTPIADGPGADFAVFENGFGSGHNCFAELGYVEVSSDGTNFLRFPGVFLLTNAPGPYGQYDVRNVYNLCGKHINAYGECWGTPFDLAELAWQPAARAGLVNLTNVFYVRIVDIPGSGNWYDSFSPSNPVCDPWPTSGSGGVDLEAVGVINSPAFVHVNTLAHGPGVIWPYGMPDGKVAVGRGLDAMLSILPLPGYHVIDVRVNGRSVGPVTNWLFTGLQSDQTLEAWFGSRFIVSSSHGVASPTGTNYGYGSFTAALSGSPETVGGTQYVCVGWSGTGSLPEGGSGMEISFLLTNDTTLSWIWQTNYWLDVDTRGHGSVDTPDSWQAEGTVVTSTASAHPWYEFAGWAGDTQGDTNSTFMALTMDRARAIVANFSAQLATGCVPVAWLVANGFTNAPDQEAMADQDGDGMATWQEFWAGTDPGNSGSVFEILEIGTSSGRVYVVWTGGTNGSMEPFRVLGTDSITGQWVTLDGNVIRSQTGTNTWHDTQQRTNRFYRIQAVAEP